MNLNQRSWQMRTCMWHAGRTHLAQCSEHGQANIPAPHGIDLSHQGLIPLAAGSGLALLHSAEPCTWHVEPCAAARHGDIIVGQTMLGLALVIPICNGAPTCESAVTELTGLQTRQQRPDAERKGISVSCQSCT